MLKAARAGRALTNRRPRGSPAQAPIGLNVCWRRAPHSPAGSQTLEFNDRSPSRHEAGDRTVPRRRPPRDADTEQPIPEPLYENYEALSLHTMGLRAARAQFEHAGRLYGHLDVIGSGVGRIERHLSSSCGSIDHWRVGYETVGEEGLRGRRLQWVLLQRWLPREYAIYDQVGRRCLEPCCPHHRRNPPPRHNDTPDPVRRPNSTPRPSCSFHNLPESYETERASSILKGKGKKASPRTESSEPEDRSEGTEGDGECVEEERTDWSLLIPEEEGEGAFFDDADYDSESDNSPPRSPDKDPSPTSRDIGPSTSRNLGPSTSKDAGPSTSTEPSAQ